jgi:hypothetical protein
MDKRPFSRVGRHRTSRIELRRASLPGISSFDFLAATSRHPAVAFRNPPPQMPTRDGLLTRRTVKLPHNNEPSTLGTNQMLAARRNSGDAIGQNGHLFIALGAPFLAGSAEFGVPGGI